MMAGPVSKHPDGSSCARAVEAIIPTAATAANPNRTPRPTITRFISVLPFVRWARPRPMDPVPAPEKTVGEEHGRRFAVKGFSHLSRSFIGHLSREDGAFASTFVASAMR